MLTLIYIINSINNAIMHKKSKVIVKRFNNLSLNVLKILQNLNIIESFIINNSFTECKIYLYTYVNYFTKIICITKPSKYNGLNEFKLNFNPKVIEYAGDFELITNRPLYFMYRNSKDISNMFKK